MLHVNAKSLRKLMVKFGTLENPPTLLIFGDPGTGKTAAVTDGAADMGRIHITLSLGRLEAYDIKGIPAPEGDYIYWKAPAFWKEVIDSRGNIVVHFDEFTLADENVQGAVLDIVLNKRLDNIKLPEKTQFIITGNMGGEDGTFARIITSALTGGRGFVYKMQPPSISDWIEYQQPLSEISSFIKAMGVRALVTGPDKTNPFDPWTCARSWSELDKLLKALKLDPTKEQDLQEIRFHAMGILSYSTVSKFMEYLSDTMLDPMALYKKDKKAWASYKKALALRRSNTLDEVVGIMTSEAGFFTQDNTVITKIQEFLELLVKNETEADILVKFLNTLGEAEPLMMEALKIEGKTVGVYFDELLNTKLNSKRAPAPRKKK